MTRTPLRASPWPATWLLVGAGVVSAMQVGKAPAALQEVQHDLAMPLAQAAWLLSAFGIVAAVCGVAIGLAADRFGARRALIAGLLLQGAASAVGALAQAPALLIASRVVEGIGFLCAIVAAPTLLAHLARGRSTAGPLAVWSTFMPVGMALILLASPWLLSQGWRAVWLAGSAAALLYAAAVAWLVCLVHHDGPSAKLRAVKLVDGGVGHPRIRHLHEGKAARPTGLAVCDDLDLRYLP